MLAGEGNCSDLGAIGIRLGAEHRERDRTGHPYVVAAGPVLRAEQTWLGCDPRSGRSNGLLAGAGP